MSRWRQIALAAALVGAVVLAYWGTLHGEFLWDDDLHVYKNPRIIGPEGLREIWTTAAANYFPLVLTNFWLQHAVWGLNPFGYHAVTIACHAFSALLLWRVLLALGATGFGAWLGAALWALHPVQVESVAWISELKNTQSAIFFLLAVLGFLRWLDAPPGERSGRAAYILTLGYAVLALMSKPSTVMLPVALALIAWWRRGEVRRRDALALAPCFLLSAVVSGWTIWEQKFHSGAIGPEWSQTWPERIAIAGRVIWFYLGKLAWPHPLTFIYPRWDISADLREFLPALGVLAGIGVLWWRRGRWRVGFLAAGFFVALLFPVLGFFSVYFFRYSFVGDHFQYLASLAPLALAGVGIARLPRKLALAVASLAVLGCAGLTVREGKEYRNNLALWGATVADNPAAHMAWMNLADSLSKAGRHAEAIEGFRRANRLRPGDPDGHNDLGCELVLVGQPAEALAEFAEALRLRPNYAETHANLGNALWYLGCHRDALAAYQRAVALKPDHGEAQNNLGATLAQLGRAEEALPHFAIALRIKPDHAEAYDNLGNALRMLGRLPAAIAAHEHALRLRPDFAEAHHNLAIDLAASGRTDDALAHYRRALALRPDFVAASGGLAKLLAGVGREAEARRMLEAAVRATPDSAGAHHNLGTHLARFESPAAGIAEFEQAVRLDPGLVAARLNLGAAYGAAGRWLEAARQFELTAKSQPDSAEAFTGLGVALANAGRLDTAVLSLRRALQLAPGSAEAHAQLAQILRALGREREAAEHQESATRLRSASPAEAAPGQR